MREEERVGKAVPGLVHTVLAPSGEERTLNAAAQVESAALRFMLPPLQHYIKSDSLHVHFSFTLDSRARRP